MPDKPHFTPRETVHNTDALTLMRCLPDNSVDCILTDPPYFRVKGDFDFQWQTREEFMAEAEEWATEMQRVLKPTGSLVWFTSDKMLGHMQVMLERHFHYLNLCTIRKRNSIQPTFASIKDQRTFLPCDERFLFMSSMGEEYSKDNPAVLARNAHKYAEGMLHQRLVRPVVEYLDGERRRAGKSVKEINEALGLKSMAMHWFTFKSQFVFPTRKNYEALRDYLNGYPPRDFLRKEYDDLRRPFKMEERQLDVFDITVDGGACARLGHPTVKDLKLIRQLVRTITRAGDLILDPFLGSGTTAVAALMEGRRYIGGEREAKYYDIARRRIAATQPALAI